MPDILRDRDLRRRALGFAALALLAVITCNPSRAQSAEGAEACDRACLRSLVDQYLSALATRDSARLALAEGFCFTENGVRLAPGEATWATVSRVRPPLFVLTDPMQQSAAVWTVIEEGGRPALLAAHLIVARGKLASLETTVARTETAALMNPEGWMQDRAVPGNDLTVAEQRARAELIRNADAYFAALVNNAAPLPGFTQDCNRIENGVRSTNNPVPAGKSLSASVASMGCEAQFKAGALQFVSRVREVRYVLFDEEKGLALAQAVFDHDGLARKAGGTQRLAASLPSPYSFMVSELFKIRDGRIQEIRATLSQVPYGLKPDSCRQDAERKGVR